jgi:hypothetical protein
MVGKIRALKLDPLNYPNNRQIAKSLNDQGDYVRQEIGAAIQWIINSYVQELKMPPPQGRSKRDVALDIINGYFLPGIS